MDLSALEANYTPGTTAKNIPKQKTKGRGGFLTSLIQEGGAAGGAVAGGAAGAAAGSVVPVLGTAIGGILGAGIGGLVGGLGGSAVEQKVRDDEVDWKKAAGEGLLSGATGAIAPGGAGALLKAGVKKGTQEAAEQTATKGSLLSKFKQGAKDTSSKGYGVEVGQGVGRGQVRTPDQAAQVTDFITNGAQKYGGIRAGKPIDQARDAQNVHNNVVKQLDATLTKIDRPLDPTESNTIVNNIVGKIKENAAITKGTATADKLSSKVQNAKSIKELEAIRREADDLAYTSNGAGKTSAAAQARSVRDSIDEFITPLSPEYKAIKGDYRLSKDALDSTSKASKGATGIPVPLTNGNITLGGQSVQGVKNRLSSAVSGTGKSSSQPTLVNKLIRAGAPQLAASGLSNIDETSSQTPKPFTEQSINDENLVQSSATDDLQEPEQTYSLENLRYDIQRDPTNAADYLKIYQTISDAENASGLGKLSAAQKNSLIKANSANAMLDSFEQQLSNIGLSDNGIEARARGLVSSVTAPAGLDQNAKVYNDLRGGLATQLAKALGESGALSDQDVARAIKLIPSLGATRYEAQQNIDQIRAIVNGIKTSTQQIGQ
jgi:hypothetical protein